LGGEKWRASIGSHLSKGKSGCAGDKYSQGIRVVNNVGNAINTDWTPTGKTNSQTKAWGLEAAGRKGFVRGSSANGFGGGEHEVAVNPVTCL